LPLAGPAVNLYGLSIRIVTAKTIYRITTVGVLFIFAAKLLVEYNPFQPLDLFPRRLLDGNSQRRFLLKHVLHDCVSKD
jgi:hypothetical protein